MRKCGKIPFSRLEDNIQMFEQNKNMKEEIKAKDEALASLKQENEKLKSADSAIILYERKFQDMNA